MNGPTSALADRHCPMVPGVLGPGVERCVVYSLPRRSRWLMIYLEGRGNPGISLSTTHFGSTPDTLASSRGSGSTPHKAPSPPRLQDTS